MSNDNNKFTAIGNYIYLGSFEPAFNQDDEFQKLGINVVINCGHKIRYPEQKYPFILENYPIADGDSVIMLENMDTVIEKIHHYLLQKKKIYLHCIDGVSVSPAILTYYLMVHKKYSYDQAYKLIQKLRPLVDIHCEFTNQLRVIEEN